MITKDERYPVLKTVAEWNELFNGSDSTKKYSIVGLVTNLNNTYCAKCVPHVQVFELSDTAKFVYADEDFCDDCISCSARICTNCDGEY